jgi:ATP-dependent DNA helicase RecG
VLAGTGVLQARAEVEFGFALTGSQRRALAEIAGDMKSPHRMMRLLQGDVGSGKTVVALQAMLIAVESGAQAALLAPTEVLARQHHQTLRRLAAPAGVEIGLLTGREKGRARDSMLASLASGLTPVVVGTLALLQEDVVFRDLALAVIDEQHRFGVEQRLVLSAKGRDADTLLMSATPIPRTLMLTVYGDLDTSHLTDKPPGRRKVDTRTLPLDRIEQVIEAIARALQRGAKVFWVCPIVEESENADIAAAEERYRALSELLPGRVGLVHGRMKSADKDRAMAAFAAASNGNGVDLLVATTVIEVGIDVPAATVMVIEHAERFGLAQLHQLRGRVGRGGQRSACLLVHEAASEEARARIAVMCESHDGFRIAEEDLRLRGPGELFGRKQSGLPGFRFGDLRRDLPLLQRAQALAAEVIAADPELQSDAHAGARVALERLAHSDRAVVKEEAG